MRVERGFESWGSRAKHVLTEKKRTNMDLRENHARRIVDPF